MYAILMYFVAVNKRLTRINNSLSVHHIISLAIINRLFSMLKGLKRTVDSTRPAPLSMNEFTTVYWNSYTNSKSLQIFRNSKYRNPRNKNRSSSFIKVMQ